MAHALEVTSKALHIQDVINFFSSLNKKLERYKAIRKTENELHSLTDRELNDIGISRHDIYRIARS